MKKLLIACLLFALVFTLSACEPESFDDGRPTIPDGEVPDDKKTDDDEISYCKSKDYTYDYSSLVYDLVWSDEFDGDEVDSSKWVYEVNGDGGGNGELQYYTRNNTTVADGILTITARLEDYLNHDYTSSRMTTENKGEFTYGVFEIKAKIPAGRGTWPAIWMMPSTSRYGTWPDSGEIDIMEHVGYDENVIHATIHIERFNGMDGTQKGGTITDSQDVTEEFHVYKVEWLPDKLKFYMDGVNYFTYTPSNYASCPTSELWPYDGDFFMILNVAVGGTWGGVQGVDDDAFPTSMEVDYVRVYQSETISNIIQGE